MGARRLADDYRRAVLFGVGDDDAASRRCLCFSARSVRFSDGFLYGWTLFLVVQTGTIAAVAIAFAKFLGVFATSVSPDNYLVFPIR
jgi:hypothetical protein